MWRLLTHPGTFHALVRAVATACGGGGWAFAWPGWAANGRALQHSASALSASRAGSSSGGALMASAEDDDEAAGAGGDGADGNEAEDAGAESEAADPTYFGAHPDPDWDRRVLSAEKELAFFKHRAIDGGEEPGTGAWELMMDKDLPHRLRYTAWRRTLPDGKTEYKSITVAPDSHPEEANDLFFDDAYRQQWDGMVTQHGVLEHGDFARRQQVVRWTRRFPFAFLSDRQYAIGRCMVREPASAWSPSADRTPGAATPSLDAPTLSSQVLYGLTRGVRHPREDRRTRVVRMDVFWSHWRSRGVPCPWGTGRMACESVLLHHEQFKIPENLARFAVRHGMWGFVRSLSTKTAQFVAARRERVPPDARDPQAYGAGCAPDPPTAEEVARAEADEAALARAAASGRSGGKGGKGGGGASRQGSLQSSLSEQLPPLLPAAAAAAAASADDDGAGASADTPPQIARTPSQAFSVASSEGTTASEAAASSAAAGAADPAFVSWAHSAPVVARLRSALPSAPPGAVSIHHSLSNASVAGLATVPSMVWSKIARVGSFGAGLAAMAASAAGGLGGGLGGGAGGGAGGAGAGHDADGTDSVVDFGGEGGGADTPSRRAGHGRDQSGGLGSPDAFVSVRPGPSSSGGGGGGGASLGGRSVSFARLGAARSGGGGGASLAEQQQKQQQQQARMAHQRAVTADAERHEQEDARAVRRRRAAAAVLAAGAIALAVGGGGIGSGGSSGRRRVVAALPSPAEEQRRRRERQRQHQELRRAEREREHEAKPQQQQRPQSPPLKAFPLLTRRV